MADDLFKKLGSKFSQVGQRIRAEKLDEKLSRLGERLGADKLDETFSHLGARIRSGAVGLKKAAGIGVGRVELHLDRFEFRPGDEVSGRVVLALEDPTEAERVVVALHGTRERVSYDRDASGSTHQRTHEESVFEFERELAGKGVYQDQELSFSLTIPPDACDPPKPKREGEGVLGEVARVVSAVASTGRLPTSWRVIAFVDLPWKRNVKKQVDITIRT